MHYPLRLLDAFLLFLAFVAPARALTFALPTSNDGVVGQVQWTQSLPGDTFSKIGRRYDVGYFELVEANSGIDANQLIPGTIVVIPSRFILPPGPRVGIVINLAELRLYYYPPHRPVVITHPAGIGREGENTPVGSFRITERLVDPTWVVPQFIHEKLSRKGVHLPKKVLPGPDNPLGGYAMRLERTSYMIHGTNDYQGVGRRSSGGCLRLLPEDIESLFPEIKWHERVKIINVPYKVAWDHNRLYLEAHVPLKEVPAAAPVLRAEIQRLATDSSARMAEIQWPMVDELIQQHNGIPQVIGRTQ